MLARAMRIFFVQSSKKIAMQLFRKENFPSFLSFKKWKRSSSGKAECGCDNPAKNFSSNFWKLLIDIGNWRKNDKLSKKFIRQTVRLNMHNEILASLPYRCCQKYGKFSRTPKKLKLQFFQQNSFFHQKRLFSNRECIFYNASKNFSQKIHRFAARIPKTTKKSGIFWKDSKFPQNVPMYM